MDGQALADHIRRSLRVVVEANFAWQVAAQIDDGTPGIQLPGEGTAELTFAIRGIPYQGMPSAYLVLRETRDARDPDRVVEYWYGLVHRRVGGDVVYEAWHRHDHCPGTSNDAHHHLKVNDVSIDRKPGVALHAQPAILQLLESLTERIGEDQGE